MDWNLVLEIAKIAGLFVLGALSLYFKANETLNKKANALVAEAEAEFKDIAKSGGQKFEWVVDNIYGVIPAYLRMFLTREMVENAVQMAWEIAEQYAKETADKFVDKAVAKVAAKKTTKAKT